MSESSETVAKKPFTTDIEIPFESERHANIITDSLLVDWRHESERFARGTVKDIRIEGNRMVISLRSDSLKHLRVNINSILEFVILLIETVDNFDISLPVDSITELAVEKLKASTEDENGNLPATEAEVVAL